MTEPADTLTAADEFLTPAWWTRLAAGIQDDPELGHVGRWSNLRIGLFDEHGGGTATFSAGKLVSVEPADTPPAEDAVIMRGSSRAWAAFLQPVPPPQHNDVLAMDRRQPDFEISGARAVLIRNLRFIQLVMAKCRDVEVAGR